MNKFNFGKLFEPVRVGRIELKNRIVMPAMLTNYGTPDGYVTRRMIDYYAERGRGGAGLIVVEETCIDGEVGRGGRLELRIDSDEFIPGLRQLAGAIEEGGARAFIQINHSGGYLPGRVEGIQPVAPSAVSIVRGAPVPRELSIGDIEEIVESFAQAAYRAKQAGFDGVEIHAGHGYLLCQFLSPLSNKRLDGYGGSVEARARLVSEVIRAIRLKVGADFAISCRISGDEFAEGGINIDMACQIARILEQAGIDLLSVSVGSWFTRKPVAMAPMALPRGLLVYLADAIKKVVNIPVITVGRINTPQLAEDILREGKADLIAMGRALVADPGLPQKAARGEVEEICPCIACNVVCVDRVVYSDEDLKCAVNPWVGEEGSLPLTHATTGKKVLVVGGGPAGMEAAIMAAKRGHSVTLWERKDSLGGQMLLAALPPGKDEIYNLIEYLRRQVEQAGVDVQLGKIGDAPSIFKEKPDAVIIATGSVPLRLSIPGVERDTVTTAIRVLETAAEGLGQEIVVIGGGEVGCETAAFLSQRGRKVTIVEILPRMMNDVGPGSRSLLLATLREKGVEMLTNATVNAISETGISISIEKLTRQLSYNNIVLAVGSKPSDGFESILKGKISEVYRVGDSSQPGKIFEAVSTGWEAAIKL